MATKKQQRRKYMRAKEHARQPPSWSRAAKRAAIFAAGLLIVVQILGAGVTPAQAAVEAGMFFIWLIVLGYYMDRFIYSRWLKQQQG
jgi:hypothetical protein